MRRKYSHIIALFVIIIGFFCALISPAVAFDEKISGARVAANGDVFVAERRGNLIARILRSAFFPFSYEGLLVFIDTNQREPRGQIRGKDMRLSAHIVSDAEFLQLFVHELGHFVDIYMLRASRFSSDPSQDFYAINWKKPTIKRPAASLSSFVSGYAATNQYEDFAETFVWYVFHNDTFAEQAMKNEDLRRKYLFFSDVVFVNGEFQGTDFSLGEVPAYLWDTTKAPILLENYLSFLR